MFETKTIGTNLSVAIAALMFGSTMILSAVAPARATASAPLAANQQAPETVRYLA